MTGRCFIGSEITAALVGDGCSVAMVFPGAGIGGRVFPAELAEAVTEEYRARGVEVVAGTSVAGVERDGDVMRVRLADDRMLEVDEVDEVVAGLGIEPNVELAAAAGIAVDGGIVVDEYVE